MSVVTMVSAVQKSVKETVMMVIIVMNDDRWLLYDYWSRLHDWLHVTWCRLNVHARLTHNVAVRWNVMHVDVVAVVVHIMMVIVVASVVSSVMSSSVVVVISMMIVITMTIVLSKMIINNNVIINMCLNYNSSYSVT